MGTFLSAAVFGLHGRLLRGNPGPCLEKARLTAESFELKGVAEDVALRTTIVWGSALCPQQRGGVPQRNVVSHHSENTGSCS